MSEQNNEQLVDAKNLESLEYIDYYERRKLREQKEDDKRKRRYDFNPPGSFGGGC